MEVDIRVEEAADMEVGIVVGTRVEEEEDDLLRGSRGIMDTGGEKRSDRLYHQFEWNDNLPTRSMRERGCDYERALVQFLVESSISF